MSSIPLLPRLNDEKKIAFSKRGEWKSDSQNTLPNLVKDLKVTTDYKSTITSIPDLWARPAMYEMVLFNENHHLHKQYLEQWRGILAILALREMRNFKDVKCHSIILPKTTKLAEDAPVFLKVLANMLPEEYKSEKYKDETVDNGYKIQLISYQERSVAIVWPTILLCPAVSLDYQIDRSISWWEYNGIKDPVSSLSDQEKCLLKKWLDGIKDSLPENDYKANKLMKLLQDFQDDLKVTEKASNYALGSGLNITGFCKALDKPIRCSIDGAQFLAASNVMLINLRRKAAKNLLVMTKDMYQQWNKAASDIMVAGNVNLDAALPCDGRLYEKDKLNGIDLSKYNVELRMGTDFFTEKICLIESQDDSFPNALTNIKINYGSTKNVLMPIKKELLDYLSPEYLVQHFRCNVTDKGIKVELDLPLKGFDENGNVLVISKEYNDEQVLNEWERDIIDDLRAPIIQIWPNFIPNNEDTWQAYYSLCDNNGYPNTFFAQPLWEEGSYDCRNLTFSDVEAEICKGKIFPGGFVCWHKMHTISGPREIELGLILIQKPKNLQLTTGKSCRIGVDFGTTNTVTYMSMNDNQHMIQLQNRLYNVTTVDSETAPELRRHFFTSTAQPNGESISIRTLFNPNEGAFSGNINQAVFHGVIYYLDGMDNIGKDKNIDKLVQGRDMKWDSAQTAAQGINYMSYFLYQMTVQCMAEAIAAGATNIEWYYSYPKAFNDTQIEKLETIWISVLDNCKNISPINSQHKAIAKTESVSMAEFFKNEMKGTFKRGMVCFDIGGGSTDIAIWQGSNNDKPVGQCSLMFAGQDIFNRQLFKNRDILLEFKSIDDNFNTFVQKLYDVPAGEQNKFNMELEALLKYNQNILLDSLKSNSERRNVKLFLRNIAFALSGIFYYAGGIVGECLDFSDKNQSLPHCFVGGNASKLLDWVAEGNYAISQKFEDVYTTFLRVGVASKQNLMKNQIAFNVFQSSNPKEEVAYGLVCDTVSASNVQNNTYENEVYDPLADLGINTIDPYDDKSLLAGEKIWINGNAYEDLIITTNDVQKGISVDANLPNFKRFLNAFNALMSRKQIPLINFGEREFDELKDQTNEYLDQQSRLQANEINLEPPFIIILKQALELLSK